MKEDIGLSLSADEATARTIHCSDCNAPPNQPCQNIIWHDKAPVCRPRRYHTRRLKDAQRVALLREKRDAEDAGCGFVPRNTDVRGAMPAMAGS